MKKTFLWMAACCGSISLASDSATARSEVLFTGRSAGLGGTGIAHGLVSVIVPGRKTNMPQLERFSLPVSGNLYTGVVVINEILFNPRAGGVDFVEIYNRGTAPVDLKGWSLANRNASGVITSPKTLAAQTHLLAPGAYRVITANAAVVREQYHVKDPSALLELAALPAYANAGGTVIISDPQGLIVDEVQYSEKWHFELLDDVKGISLERMNADGPSQHPDNWHSAASDAGFATPGYRNSQAFEAGGPSGDIVASPRVFSPDSDGLDDYAVISYRFPEPGYVCTITIFNRAGVPVRYLARNALCGKSGFFKWDGLDEKASRLSIGTYIIFAETFNLQGKTKTYKRVITLARKLG